VRILSLGGAGAVCRHATRDLAEFSDFDSIVIGDTNVAAAEKLAADIDDPRLQVLRVDAEDYGGLVRTFRDFDVILNGLPWKYDLAVTRACVEAGVSGLDVSTEESQWEYAQSVTFFVNPDQLSILAIGAQYHSAPEDPVPVIAPFGSGCMQLLPFKNLTISQASIGTTDIAMRQQIPPDILGFTVTCKMFKQLCELDEQSFLYKDFLKRLKKARGFPDI